MLQKEDKEVTIHLAANSAALQKDLKRMNAKILRRKRKRISRKENKMMIKAMQMMRMADQKEIYAKGVKEPGTSIGLQSLSLKNLASQALSGIPQKLLRKAQAKKEREKEDITITVSALTRERSLTNEDLQHITSNLEDAMLLPLGFYPRIKGILLDQDRIHVTCADRITSDWVEAQIGMLLGPHHEHNSYTIELTGSKSPIKMNTFYVLIPPRFQGLDRIMKLLKLNKGILIKKFHILKVIPKDNGYSVIIFGVENIMVKWLAKIRFRPFCGVGTLEFFATGPLGNLAQQKMETTIQQAPMTSEPDEFCSGPEGDMLQTNNLIIWPSKLIVPEHSKPEVEMKLDDLEGAT